MCELWHFSVRALTVHLKGLVNLFSNNGSRNFVLLFMFRERLNSVAALLYSFGPFMKIVLSNIFCEF